LQFMMRCASEMGIGKVRFVLDQGFVTGGTVSICRAGNYRL
jgi:hypothetical protein